MKINRLAIFFVLSIMFIHSSYTYLNAQNTADSLLQVRRASRFIIPNRSLELYDVNSIQTEDWTELFTIPEHPGFNQLMTAEKRKELLDEINTRKREQGIDTLLTSDYFYVWRPYFDWLHYEDPHYRALSAPHYDPATYKNSKAFNNATGSRRLPFTTLCINDTIIVQRSCDPDFQKGDMIVSINGITMPEYLKYNYEDRYSEPLVFMINYYYSFAVDRFDIISLRDNREQKITTTGIKSNDVFNKLFKAEEYDVNVYEDVNTGYVQIKKFHPNNSRLLKIVNSAIKDFKKRGITNVILDLRRNLGGSGHSLDKLLSIFIDKPVIPYMKSQKVMVSEQTLGDYDFLTKEMIGQLVDVLEKDIITEFKTDPKMYVEGMNYYVMVSSDTGSTAATFVNILQYNDAAKLVGEPLLHNALKYGEVIYGKPILHTLLLPPGISTVEFDEYTKAVDGVIAPDIPIPYVASDYLQGEDGMLNKLLAIIKYN